MEGFSEIASEVASADDLLDVPFLPEEVRATSISIRLRSLNVLQKRWDEIFGPSEPFDLHWGIDNYRTTNPNIPEIIRELRKGIL
ncbi:17406_t:CDS:2 [Funneliformis caledonium]|uniref:17406_t:CDS:1 n=1 Tax=Funneliformis caledonium TaxID=1117310 RepID=A0A9N9AZK6_9GLOM|nr:17406_t:CDS:2 [Funneliformis caledonium]